MAAQASLSRKRAGDARGVLITDTLPARKVRKKHTQNSDGRYSIVMPAMLFCALDYLPLAGSPTVFDT